jgi:hypothetical protein
VITISTKIRKPTGKLRFWHLLVMYLSEIRV